MKTVEIYFEEYDEENWNKYASCFEKLNTHVDGVPQEIVNVVFNILVQHFLNN